MTDPTDPIRLLDNAPARRLWLLAEAVRSVPFDRALDLARPAAADRDQVTTPTSSIDEIVRYLRQQDDVVVPQEDDGYLVNGRFRMSAAELTLRANRMRYRQGRPAFDTGNAAFPDHANAAPRGHPLFWEQAAATDPTPNGFHRPADIDTEGA